jgi:PadR family transcriptional regulator, regulatory protein PadR
MADAKSEILQGTLDPMALKTLDAMGPLHGYGIARRIEQISEESLQVNQGTVYLCLIRLVQKKWIAASWGTSENDGKSKFYTIRNRAASNSPLKRRIGSASPARSAVCCSWKPVFESKS